MSNKKHPFKSGQYLISCYNPKQFPSIYKGNVPLIEIVAFGRSNVGKSSLLNHLVQQQNLAKFSKTPGKTQSINYFLIDQNLYWVDMPGYGFAKVDQKQKKDWESLVKDYFTERNSPRLVLLLFDIRRGLREEDRELIHWINKTRTPHLILFTKADKFSKNQLHKVKVQSQRDPDIEELLFYSNTTQDYRKGLIQYINHKIPEILASYESTE